jgi:tripartite-type tricarboxylate transporter receptor subunit TctC
MANRLLHPRSALLALAFSVAACGLSMADEATNYPDKPIHVIVPFAPGGATDVALRLLQPSLEKVLGKTLVIDNRGGASGMVGLELAAHAQPDGYTLFFGNVGTVSIDPIFFSQLKANPERDFIPISLAGETPGIVVASTKFPPNTLKEMVVYAKAHPGKINYGVAGISTLNSLAMEQFRRSSGLAMTQVPYKGGAGPALVDLIAGNIDMMLVTLSAASSHVKNGQLKALAVTTAERVPLLPDVATMAEQGFPDSVSSSWQGLFAIAGTPQPIVAKLHAAVLKAMADPDARKRMADAGILPTVSKSPEAFKDFLATETVKWKPVVEQIKATEKNKTSQ